MRITGETQFPFSRDEAWKCLNDPVALRDSVPLCEALVAHSPTDLEATVAAKVGPIKARFNGTAVISQVVPPESYVLTANGKGGLAGFASAVIAINMTEEAAGTRLAYVVEAKLGGKLAQLGSRMIETAARNWAEEFFGRFSLVVQNGGVMPQDAAASAAAASIGYWSRVVAWAKGIFSSRQGADTPLEQARLDSDPEVSTDPESPAAASIAPRAPLQRLRALATGFIDIDIGNQLAQITLNRPEDKNCISLGMWQELSQIFDDLSDNRDVRCIILTGAGGNFSSGADIAEFAEVRNTAQQTEFYEQAVEEASAAIQRCSKAVLAMVEGYCIGGALGLAMACDFRVCARGSIFFIPAAKMSIVYGLRGTHSLLSAVGIRHARRILYTGERIHSAEAAEIGLVDEVAEPDALQDCVELWVNHLRSAAPLTIAGSKTILNGLDLYASPQLVQQAESLIRSAGDSEDYREGRQAFAEQRAPEFRGC